MSDTSRPDLVCLVQGRYAHAYRRAKFLATQQLMKEIDSKKHVLLLACSQFYVKQT